MAAVDPISVDMGNMLRAFVAHERMVGYSERTIDRRRNTVELFQASLGGAPATRDAVEAFVASRPAAETRRGYLGDLRRFYAWAVSRGFVAGDPTVDIDTPRVPERDPNPLQPEEVAAVRAACRDRQDRLVIGLGLFAGLRSSEIAHLDRRDVRLTDRVIVVRGGKGGRDRRVPLAGELHRDLAVELVEHDNRQGVYWRTVQVFRRAGVEGHRPHDLRATFATELARRSNGNLQLVAVLCGWKSLQTARRYVGWYPEGSDIIDELYAA